MSSRTVQFQNLDNVTYQEAWDYQTKLHRSLIDRKLALRKAPPAEQAAYRPAHQLIFCEHSHVYTLGKSGSTDHLLIDDDKLAAEAIEYFKINRGGDITYHGPGQITGYPIFDLEDFFTDVHRYVRSIEEVIIRTLAHYGLTGSRVEGYTGVWIVPEDSSQPKRKICAIGVHLSRWVTMHGFAFNINTDLDYFGYIVPCGIVDPDKTVTSLASELGQEVNMMEVKAVLRDNFAEVFDFTYLQ